MKFSLITAYICRLKTKLYKYVLGVYTCDLSKIYNTFIVNLVVLECYLKVFFHKNLIIEFLLLQLENPKKITNEVENQSNFKQTHIN